MSIVKLFHVHILTVCVVSFLVVVGKIAAVFLELFVDIIKTETKNLSVVKSFQSLTKCKVGFGCS